jgi:hypothetical protein
MPLLSTQRIVVQRVVQFFDLPCRSVEQAEYVSLR